MQCPQCDMPLESWRWFSAGTYVCPVCRGMWTDSASGLVTAGSASRVGRDTDRKSHDGAEPPPDADLTPPVTEVA